MPCSIQACQDNSSELCLCNGVNCDNEMHMGCVPIHDENREPFCSPRCFGVEASMDDDSDEVSIPEAHVEDTMESAITGLMRVKEGSGFFRVQ